MEKTQTVEESMENGEEYVRVAKKEKKVVMVEGEGEGEVEEGGQNEGGGWGRGDITSLLRNIQSQKNIFSIASQ